MSQNKNGKILLVNLKPSYDYDYSYKGNVYPSTAILILGTVLKRNGYDIAFIDQAYDENYLELVKKELTDDLIYVGFSVMTANISEALSISKEIKQINPEIKIVWGGPHPTFFWKHTALHPLVDIVVVNEGVKAAIAVAEKLKNKEDISGIKGIAYKQGEEIIYTGESEKDDINEIGALDHSFYPYERYVKNILLSTSSGKERLITFPIITGLGCGYKCKFCINVVLERKYRFKTTESIITEIKDLKEKYGANAVHFLDEDFFINKKRLFDLFKLVEKENLKFHWRTWMRAGYFKENYINPEIVSWLVKLGWQWTSIGAESGTQEMLDVINKKITVADTLNSAKTLRKGSNDKHKIWTRYTFIVGLPKETTEQVKETFKLAAQIKEINEYTDVDVGTFRPYPGSPLTDELVKINNFQFPDDLEKWSELVSRDGFLEGENANWLSAEQTKIIKLAGYCIRIINSNMRNRHFLLKFILFFLRKLSFLRLKNKIYILPLEVYLFDLYNYLRNLKYVKKILIPS